MNNTIISTCQHILILKKQNRSGLSAPFQTTQLTVPKNTCMSVFWFALQYVWLCVGNQNYFYIYIYSLGFFFFNAAHKWGTNQATIAERETFENKHYGSVPRLIWHECQKVAGAWSMYLVNVCKILLSQFKWTILEFGRKQDKNHSILWSRYTRFVPFTTVEAVVIHKN